MAESRLERWQRTGALHIVTAAVVFATWIYFQTQFAAADRPVVLNEVLLAAVTWMGVKFFNKRDDDKEQAEEPTETDSSSPEPEPEKRGRHAK